MAEGRSQPSLGEYLVREGFISQADFNEAHQLQLETSRSLGRILVDAGKITESMRLNLLSKRFGYPHLRPEGTISPELLNLIPQSFAEKHRAVPISLADDLLTVAMEDPSDMLIVDAIKNQVGLDVQAGVASREDIDRVLSQYGAAAAAAPPRRPRRRRPPPPRPRSRAGSSIAPCGRWPFPSSRWRRWWGSSSPSIITPSGSTLIWKV